MGRSPCQMSGWRLSRATQPILRESVNNNGGGHASSEIRTDGKEFSDLRLRRSCHGATVAVGARQGLAYQGRARSAQEHDLVRPRERPANRQWQGRKRIGIAADPWLTWDGKRTFPGRTGPQARYPACLERAQSRSEEHTSELQ